MAEVEISRRNIFVILEEFLIKVASLDVFEVLIFNYKLKDEYIGSLSCSFIPIIDELFFEVQELLADYKKNANALEIKSRELSMYPSLPENIESSHIPEDEKLIKENIRGGSVVNPVDVIPQSLLNEMPLFSPKIIVEDNLDVDASDSLWNSDSKSADLLTNQINLQDISNHSSESDNCGSFQCLSCQKLFTHDSKLGANTCQYCRKKSSNNSSHLESSYSNHVDVTKLSSVSQEYPLDFRHSTEIGCLIEDALHMPKESSLRVDYKAVNEPCAIHLDSSDLQGCQTTVETDGNHSERKSALHLNNEICLQKTVIKETFSHQKDADNKSLELKSQSDNIPGINNSTGKGGDEASRSHKRIVCSDSDEDFNTKSPEALHSAPENCNMQCNEGFSECALVNSVIINSVAMKSDGEDGSSLSKIRAKKKSKRKDGGEEAREKVATAEPEPTERERGVAVSDSIKEDSWQLGKMKCLASNASPFICCKECFFVFKDWAYYRKHVCNSNPVDAQISGDEELVEGISDISSKNEKENEKADLGKLMKSLTSVAKHDIKCENSNDYKDLKAKIFGEKEASDAKCSRKQSSVITDYEALSEIHRFVCSICLEEYRSLNRIMYHLPRCVCGPYKCELCPLEYASRRELNLHKKKNHRDAQSFICDECGVKFKFRTSLQKHKVNRHERLVEKEAYSCPHCTLTFPKKIYLTNHCIKVHSLERKFLCQVCGKKFLNQNSFNAHLNSHTEEAKNRFACVHCSKTFQRKEKLLYHMRIHTGERPYKCKSCGKTFISKARLTEHLWRHGGKKRYSCPHCPKQYAGRWDLKLHVRKIHSKTLSTGDGHSVEESCASIPESPRVGGEVVASNKAAPTLAVEGVEERSVATAVRDSNELLGDFRSPMPDQDASPLSPGILVQLPPGGDHSLPHADVQSPQLIHFSSSSSNASSVPIQIQVSSATHGLEVTSHPNIIFTSGLYLS
ncbi:zinc finger protein 470-like [Ischnura elegans]|uniref:zinc finger protein 470-like n=1 Tax=Ischnura elegans TaxID=197161 RepID=UPI001ED8A825|nr:zinc finger protein 470-like [Ischnura elegans]